MIAHLGQMQAHPGRMSLARRADGLVTAKCGPRGDPVNEAPGPVGTAGPFSVRPTRSSRKRLEGTLRKDMKWHRPRGRKRPARAWAQNSASPFPRCPAPSSVLVCGEKVNTYCPGALGQTPCSWGTDDNKNNPTPEECVALPAGPTAAAGGTGGLRRTRP